jgi:hypothetical protein
MQVTTGDKALFDGTQIGELVGAANGRVALVPRTGFEPVLQP